MGTLCKHVCTHHRNNEAALSIIFMSVYYIVLGTHCQILVVKQMKVNEVMKHK